MTDELNKAGKRTFRGAQMSSAARRKIATGEGAKRPLLGFTVERWKYKNGVGAGRLALRRSGGISGNRPIYKSLAALGEVVAKAGKVTYRGKLMSRAQRRAIATDKITPRSGVMRSGGAYVLRGWGRRGNLSAHVVRKAKPKTLYVYRPVENAADIIAWAKSQGFATTLAPEDLHVTLAHSKTPLNWAMLHDDYHFEPSTEPSACCGPVLRSADGGDAKRRIKGGVREVKALGAEGAVVLAFESDTLTKRWMDFKAAGAVWSFPSFCPHITLTYDGASVDLGKVHPYSGDIVLGEECWEEVKEGAQGEAIARETAGVKKAVATIEARLGAVEKKLETAA